MGGKARELLERALAAWGAEENWFANTMEAINEIRDYLAEPEKKICDVCGEEKIIEMRYWLCDSCRTEYTDADQMKFIKEQTVKARNVEQEKKPFIRLTEVEVLALMNRDIHGYSLICAVENLLAENNQ